MRAGGARWESTVTVVDAGEWAARTVVVTGAAGGIGRATVAALLAAGATVVAFDLSQAALDEAADVARAFAVAAAVGQPLAGLVAAAGIYGAAPVEQMTDAEWHRVLRVNLRGTFL